MPAIERPLLLDLPEEWVGSRIVLRRWRDADAPALYDAIITSKEHLLRWLPWPSQYHSVDDATAFIRQQSGHWSLRAHVGLGIFSRANGSVLGGIGLTFRCLHLPAFETGYWIHVSAEGKGYMSEAVRLLTTYAFESLGAERLTIRCDARNTRSKHVPERLGFAFEGCLRHDSIGTDGTIRDTLTYAMIPEDFRRAQTAWDPRSKPR